VYIYLALKSALESFGRWLEKEGKRERAMTEEERDERRW
jgi:hypothetical protein